MRESLYIKKGRAKGVFIHSNTDNQPRGSHKPQLLPLSLFEGILKKISKFLRIKDRRIFSFFLKRYDLNLLFGAYQWGFKMKKDQSFRSSFCYALRFPSTYTRCSFANAIINVNDIIAIILTMSSTHAMTIYNTSTSINHRIKYRSWIPQIRFFFPINVKFNLIKKLILAIIFFFTMVKVILIDHHDQPLNQIFNQFTTIQIPYFHLTIQ